MFGGGSGRLFPCVEGDARLKDAEEDKLAIAERLYREIKGGFERTLKVDQAKNIQQIAAMVTC